jgi:hypothetical protein
MSVEPDRGRPTMKMGAAAGNPAPVRSAKNALSKHAATRFDLASKFAIAKGDVPRRSALPAA